MIVRLFSSGSSFKGLAAYLTHDPEGDTAQRVGWTHTLNCANDDVPCAVNEMLWTARDAELLKQEAGIRAGGRATEQPVKHVSLNWAPDQLPTREQMIENGHGFLQHMGWQEHQTVMVCHTDKAHSHVHLMINGVHPETGLKLDDNFERRRAQAWAKEYEREQGRIYCEQRWQDAADRHDAPPRNVWETFHAHQADFNRDEQARRDEDPVRDDAGRNTASENDAAWKTLKSHQRAQREEFFQQGKSAYADVRRGIYGEVREEFRDRWADYYAAHRAGGDADELAAQKAALLAEQKSRLDSQCHAARAELRTDRDAIYRTLLDQHQEQREGLRWHQAAGLDNALFFERLENWGSTHEAATGFRAAAAQVTQREAPSLTAEAGTPAESQENVGPAMAAGGQLATGVAGGLGAGLFTLGESLFAELIAAKPAPGARQTEDPDPFRAAVEQARQQHQKQEDEDRERRQRERCYGE